MVVFSYQCVYVCVLHVYLSGAAPLIFHLKGGTTYRGQCFPEFYIGVFCLYFWIMCVCVCVGKALQLKFLYHALTFLQQACFFKSVQTILVFLCVSDIKNTTHASPVYHHNNSLHVTYFLFTACDCIALQRCNPTHWDHITNGRIRAQQMCLFADR